MSDFGILSTQLRLARGGLLSTELKVPLENKEDLSVCYTPGIAEPCRDISKEPSLSKKLTIRKNTIAVVSDGSAVLGLGDIGPEAALPVMEGKCMLFKKFGGVDAFPIVTNAKTADEIVDLVEKIAPTFGGINLEDIAAPKCFEVQDRLIEKLDIPVFHDDQDGTAIVCLAALKNALKVVKKSLKDVNIVISGAGAAGIAIARLLRKAGATKLCLIDSKGIVSCSRTNLTHAKKIFCCSQAGSLTDALRGADVFIGVSRAGLVSPQMVESMNSNAIVFAMANPEPEIRPKDALRAGAKIVATGRSDFPNQINNVLVFPGLFRGLLDKGITKVTDDIKLRAADALAALVTNPTAEKIIPAPFDTGVADAIASAV